MTASTAVTGEPSEPAEFVITRVGVVGLGHMGYAFAVNLVEDGHKVLVYDRDPKRTAALSAARAAPELADLASCAVPVPSLPDADAPPPGLPCPPPSPPTLPAAPPIIRPPPP